MKAEFLSKSKISKEFLEEVVDQLKKSKSSKDIFGKIIQDLESGEKSPGHFFLQETEHIV